MLRYYVCPFVWLITATPALAEDKWAIQPLQVGQETIRYVQGVPTLELELNDGVVRVTPLPLDHGSLAFTVAVYNDSENPANFGIENVAPSFADASIRVFSKDELVKKAKNRAFWTQFGLALLGATASSLSASQRDYYGHSWVTPRGTYSSLWSTPSVAGQFQAATITAETGLGIALVQMQLDRTIVTLGDQTVQLTTVDPGESYAGRIVLNKVKASKLPVPIKLDVQWNGETYPFSFQIAKPGSALPPFAALTRRSDLRDFRARFARAPSQTAIVAPKAQQPTSSSHPPPAADFGNGRIRCVTC